MTSLSRRFINLFIQHPKASDASSGELISITRTGEIRTTQSPEKVTKIIQQEPFKNSQNAIRKKSKQWAAFTHSNLAKCHGYYEVAGAFYLTLERCPDDNLRRRLRRRLCSVAQAKAIAADVLGGLAYLHSRKTVYKALKPSHILFKGQSALLADFTTACSEYTAGNNVYYAAPEVVEGNYVPTSDIWALGVILYLATTGRLPFNGIELEDVTNSIRNEEPKWSLLPEELRPLVQQFMQKDPRSRPTAAEALRSALFSN